MAAVTIVDRCEVAPAHEVANITCNDGDTYTIKMSKPVSVQATVHSGTVVPIVQWKAGAGTCTITGSGAGGLPASSVVSLHITGRL